MRTTLTEHQERTGQKYLKKLDRSDKSKWNPEYGFRSFEIIIKAAEIKAQIKFSQIPNFYAYAGEKELEKLLAAIQLFWRKRKLSEFFKTNEEYIFKEGESFIEIIDDPFEQYPGLKIWSHPECEEFKDPLTGYIEKIVLVDEIYYSSSSALIKIKKTIWNDKINIQYFQIDEKTLKEIKIKDNDLKLKLKSNTFKNPKGFIPVEKFFFKKTITGGSTTPWVYALNELDTIDAAYYKKRYALEKIDDKIVRRNAFGQGNNTFEQKLGGTYIDDIDKIGSDLGVFGLDANLKRITRIEEQAAISSFLETVGARTTTDDRGSNNKHNFEMEMDFQGQSIKIKSEKETRQDQLNSLFFKLIKFSPLFFLKKEDKIKLEELEIEIDLKTIDIKSEIQLWDNLLKRYEKGTIELERVLQIGDGDSPQQSKVRAENILSTKTLSVSKNLKNNETTNTDINNSSEEDKTKIEELNK